MKNFFEMFAATVERFPQRPAISLQRKDSVDTVTYAELRDMAERVAAHLAGLGIARGDRCAILSDNDARWVAAYLGALRLGAVAVPLDTAYQGKQVAALLKDSGARVIFTSERFLEPAREAVASGATPVQIVLLSGSQQGLPSLDDVVDAVSAGAPAPCPATPEDTAVMLYTSGTTSDPKGVVLTHGNLIAESESVFERVHVHENDALLGVLPLFHVLSQMASILLPFIVGAGVVYLESLNTTEVLRALRERGITIFVCVPQFFYLIHERVMKKIGEASRLRRIVFRALLGLNGFLRRTARINLGKTFFGPVHAVLGERMRLLVTGGSRFDAKIGADLYALGFNIIQAYGLTECSGAATVVKEGDSTLGSVGPPLKGVEIKILPREKDAADDAGAADGEVCIRGGIVMKGYFNRPEVNAETLRDGWLHTGDLGYLDPEGRLFITGRKKEIIVTSSGKNIYPEEIEAHYLQSPYIKEICVMGLSRPGEPAAERLHAVVVPDFDVLREKKVVNAREILRFEIESLSVRLPSQKRILSYEIWNEDLPRTTTRKLKRFQIAARVTAKPQHEEEESVAAERGPRPGDDAWLAQPDVARAMAAIREAAHDKDAVHPDANIELALGLDSMERVELLTHLEEIFGVTVADEVAQKIYTVRELVGAILAATASGAALAPGAVRSSARGVRAWEQLLKEQPAESAALDELLAPKPFTTLFFVLLMKLARVAAWLGLRFRVSGREHLPDRGPFLLCPNHQGYLDPFLLAAALPARTLQQCFALGASEYFATPLTAWLARKANIVPVDPDANLVAAMQAGAFGLRHGKVLFLFPEGERSADGEIKEFKKGAPILAMHLGVPIVPVAFEGVFDFWPRNRPFNWSALLPWSGHRARMSFGPPLRLSLNGEVTPAGAAAAPAAASGPGAVAVGSMATTAGGARTDSTRAATAAARAVAPAPDPEAAYSTGALQLRNIVAAMKLDLRS